jgi:hypothetical protein
MDTSAFSGSSTFSSYLLLENILTPILCSLDVTGITPNPVNYRDFPPKSEQRDSGNSMGSFELFGLVPSSWSSLSGAPLKRANMA